MNYHGPTTLWFTSELPSSLKLRRTSRWATLFFPTCPPKVYWRRKPKYNEGEGGSYHG